jgi:hypothetical protein
MLLLVRLKGCRGNLKQEEVGMKQTKKWLSAKSVFLALSMTGMACAQQAIQGDPGQTSGSLPSEKSPGTESSYSKEPEFTVLPDKFSVLKGTLDADSEGHYYGFTALRAQQVLASGIYPPSVQFEIHDGDKWNEVPSGVDWVLRTPKPGQDIIARFTNKKGFPKAESAQYGLHFGSFPQVTRTRLKDQPVGMARIPPDAAPLGPLSTQGISYVMLEIDMADSTGKALEGGYAQLYIDLPNSNMPKVQRLFATDASGKIRERIEIGRCQGGQDALPFVEKNRGRNLWRTQFYKGDWSVHNLFAPTKGPYKTHFDSGDIGHICYQHLVKGSPYETGSWN